jgi:hypothetical protein
MLQLMFLWLDLQPKLQLKSQLATQGATGLPPYLHKPSLASRCNWATTILAQLQLQVQLQVKVCAKAVVNTRTKKKLQLGVTPFDYDSSCNWSFQKKQNTPRVATRLATKKSFSCKLSCNSSCKWTCKIFDCKSCCNSCCYDSTCNPSCNWRVNLQLKVQLGYQPYLHSFSCKFNCKWRFVQKQFILGQKRSGNWEWPPSITTQVVTEVFKNHTSSCD